MGFLKRFFSLQKKHKPQRAPLPDFGASSGGVRRAVSEQVEYDDDDEDEDEDGLGVEEDADRDMDVVPVPSSSYLRVPDANVAKRARAQGRNSSCSEEGEVDAAVARLLRSSSSRFNVVTEADYLDLPPLPHPINTVSSRSTSNLSLTPTRTTSMRTTTGSYRVTVHKRQQLSATEFPNAYPPLTPRRPGIAHTSTPNLLSIFSAPDASASTPALVDPRKVPITPREANRLNRLRQDPSVASLMRMYDDDGRLAETAFANTPAVQRTRKRWSRRKSTLTELLGCEGARQADLLWAETCLAQQSVLTKGDSASNGSTSSLSSTSTPPLDSPATSTFNELEYEREIMTPVPLLGSVPSTGSDGTETEKEDGFSSLVVELSVITTTTAGSVNGEHRAAPYTGPYRYPELKQRESERSLEERLTMDEDTTVDAGRKNSTQSQISLQAQGKAEGESGKMVRKPSQRASQVFNFIAERRERRKSQELLQCSMAPIVNLSEEVSRLSSTGETELRNSIDVKSDSINSRTSQSRKQTPTPLVSENREGDPAPSPPSPVALRPLCPAPRPGQSRNKAKSGSTNRSHVSGPGSGSVVRASSSMSASAVTSVHTGALTRLPSVSALHLPQNASGKPAKGSTAALLLMQAEREKKKERRRVEGVVTSTPHPSKTARGNGKEKERRGRRHEPVMLGETTNVDGVAQGRKMKAENGVPLDEDFENRYNAFAASLDMRTRQLGEKENAVRGVPMQMQGRRGAVDLGLSRASTATFVRPSSYKHAIVPPAPTRSQSLSGSGYENPAVPRSSAELEADLLMAEMYSRVRTRSGRGKQAANVA